ncbi:hypothetical protein ABGB14_28725 [Nonomuraea sp. B10E15]|uniref:hypothetical protein n=1 Tax=Nonomuraea sp. B10E15 TaxID=3153560 RepID=UPI00325F5B02
MDKRNKGIRLRIASVLNGCLALIGCAPQSESGASSPRIAVDQYIHALNRSDDQAIARLAPPGNDASTDIRQRVHTYGGRNIRITSIDIRSEITPKAAKAQVVGVGANGAYSETLHLSREGERWFITLGRNPTLPSNQTTASTERPTNS